VFVRMIHDSFCLQLQDEVSLAYISNKSIFAMSVLPFDEVGKVMDVGM